MNVARLPSNYAARLVSVEELVETRGGTEFLIDRLVEAGTLVQTVGPSESAKSLFWLHAAVCVARGVPFHGRRVKQGPVIYLAGEGGLGLRRRFLAIRARLGITFAELPLYLCLDAPSLHDSTSAESVYLAVEQVRAIHGAPALIVVDTLARHLAPGDENAAADVGQFVNHLTRLAPDATRTLIHHCGWVDTTRNRGSSALKAAVDAELLFRRDEDLVTVSAGKLKDGEPFAPLTFRITPQKTGLATEEGRPLDSVVLEETDAPPPAPRVQGLGQNQEKALRILEALVAGDPGGRISTTEDAWRSAVRAEDPGLAGHHRWHELVQRLADRRLIRKHGHTIGLYNPPQRPQPHAV